LHVMRAGEPAGIDQPIRDGRVELRLHCTRAKQSN
jgi:hypothetical protein